MSCLTATILPQLAAVSGLGQDRLEQMLDTARRTPLPSLPLDPAVADAMLAGRPANHDPKQGAAVLQAVAQGLRLALRQLRDRPPTARGLALLTALTGTVLPDVPPPDPQLVQAMRADLCLRPAPLPLVRRQAVLAAARVRLWTDHEANRIAEGPALAGLAWALGVRHPRIRAVVEESVEAAAAAITAGGIEPALLRRVVTAPSPRWVVRVLVNRPDLAAPALLARAAWPETAAQVLAARPELRGRRDVLNRVGSNRTVAYAVVEALGPYPALWHALPAPLRDELADHFQMTPAERAWTKADDQMAARFPWHHALRAGLRPSGKPDDDGRMHAADHAARPQRTYRTEVAQ